MSFSEVGKVAQEAAKGIDFGRKFLEQIGGVGTSVQNALSGLQNGVLEDFGKVVDNVKMEAEGWLLSSRLLSDLDNFLGDGNELVKGFSSILNAITGKNIDNSAQSLSGMLADNLAGGKLMEMLKDPTAIPVLERMERKYPGYLFRLCMEAKNVKDLANIPLQTTIHVMYRNGTDTSLVNFIDNSLSISQVLPDPAINKIMVTKTGESAPVEYKRAFEGHKYVFKNAKKETLLLKDISEFVVTGKDTTTDRKQLWEQKAEDSYTNISERLEGFVPLDQYTDYQKDKVKKVIDNYATLTPQEKTSISPSGSNVGCLKGCRNLALRTWNGFDISATTQPPIANNDKAIPEMQMDTYIPKLIKERSLPPGTIFWIRKDPTIDDPRSLNSAAGNHWFTFVGNIKKDGGEIPYFVDHMGYGNLQRMNCGYAKMRYFHQAYVPPAANEA